MRTRFRHARPWLAAAYLLIVLFSTWQRGIASREHTTFAIFRQSYVHLSHNLDLYAIYPDEHGAADQDRFKYSPSAAVLFAPLSGLSYAAGLLLWNVLNAGLLFYAVTRVLVAKQADFALFLLLPEVFTSVQASSSNGLIAALMLLCAHWIGRGNMGRAALAVAVGAAIKIFPIAVACMVATHRHRNRFIAAFVVIAVALLLIPLGVVSTSELARQYASWREIEIRDALDVQFGMSFIRALRSIWLESWPNWAFQVAGICTVLLPLSRRELWSDTTFQLRFAASLMMFVVLFNHQAERQSMVIAATGCAIWLAARPFSVPLLIGYACALSGLSVIPYAVLWFCLQTELIGGGIRATLSGVKSMLATRPQMTEQAPCRCCGTHGALLRLWCGSCATRLPAWSVVVLPRLLVQTIALLMIVDEITPGHLFFRWNLWDLLR